MTQCLDIDECAGHQGVTTDPFATIASTLLVDIAAHVTPDTYSIIITKGNAWVRESSCI